MLVEYMGKSDFPEYKSENFKITINEKDYRLDEIASSENQVETDIKENGKYLANIIIPPKETEIIPGENEEESEVNIKPLDMTRVRLVLWGRV